MQDQPNDSTSNHFGGELSNGIAKRLQIGQLFTPATPINERSLFAGRLQQVQRVVDAVCQRGQHAMIYGERGVGKTSMSNVLASFLQGSGQTVVAPRVVCDSSDTYSSLWVRVFSQIRFTVETTRMGLKPQPEQQIVSLADGLPDSLSPDIVRTSLEAISSNCLLIAIIDEFDRFAAPEETRLFADTIKILSDYAVPATIVLVGVANAVDELIQGHESVSRNLVQVPLPRMSAPELREIVTSRLPKAGMTIAPDALDKICLLSRGLPHYTHLIAQHAAWKAIEADQDQIQSFHIGAATKSAIDNSQHSIQSSYHRATMSPQKDNLYVQVLLACALATCDDFGYFAAADVRRPMSLIMKRLYEIPSFSRHLTAFCRPERGAVLQQIGEKYQRRFRFRNPLMQPYVVLKGVADGIVTVDEIMDSAGESAAESDSTEANS